MKIRITITADYLDESFRCSYAKVCDILHRRMVANLEKTKLLSAGGVTPHEHTVVVVGTTYVVMRNGKPVASYAEETLAQFYIDHDEHPEWCSIEEVETC